MYINKLTNAVWSWSELTVKNNMLSFRIDTISENEDGVNKMIIDSEKIPTLLIRLLVK